MKSFVYRILILMGIILGFQEKIHAYITVASTSYSLEVGVDKYLSVPNAYDGYIDHAVWACSKSEISFNRKDAAGAIIKIAKAFSGVAIVEVLATEKYIDSFGFTRARTYYKQYLISCIGGGSGGGSTVEDAEIIIPETITMSVGESKRFKVFKGDAVSFTTYWKKYSGKAAYFVSINRDVTNGYIDITGVMPGDGILTIVSPSGSEKDCAITVSAPEITTNRRTEKAAVYDIKSLIAHILPIAKTAELEDIMMDRNAVLQMPNHIYNIQGVLIKKDAVQEDIESLAPGVYIIGGKKILVK